MSASAVRTIPVAACSGAYDVDIGAGLLSGRRLAPFATNSRLVIVSDRTVWRLYGAKLDLDLASEGIEAVPLLLIPGERAKGWGTVQRLCEALLRLNLERGEAIVAFGGGVVGDVAGFAASIIKRGCPLVQVPTTLLAQVDSSVGGKTAINSQVGKNLIGTFHQPSAVLIDTHFLTTLSPRHRRNGWAEIVKYGLIADASFFAWCEARGPDAIGLDADAMLEAIAISVAMKARIVEADEQERNGVRALLNFGHSFGHALEREASYSNRLLHGEAVAVGMVLAMRLSAKLGLCPADHAVRLGDHLKRVGLPADLNNLGLATSAEQLTGHMRSDKKVCDGRLPLILSRGIGCAFGDDSVEPEALKNFLDEQLHA